MTDAKTLEDKLDLCWQHVLKAIIEHMCYSSISISSLYVGQSFTGKNVIIDANSFYACSFCVKFGVDGKNYVPRLLDDCFNPFSYNAYMPFSSLPLDSLESIHDDIFKMPLVVLKNRFGRSGIAIKPSGIVDALHKVGLVPEEIMINLDLKACLHDH